VKVDRDARYVAELEERIALLEAEVEFLRVKANEARAVAAQYQRAVTSVRIDGQVWQRRYYALRRGVLGAASDAEGIGEEL
jgi:hypothetical protein